MEVAQTTAYWLAMRNTELVSCFRDGRLLSQTLCVLPCYALWLLWDNEELCIFSKSSIFLICMDNALLLESVQRRETWVALSIVLVKYNYSTYWSQFLALFFSLWEVFPNSLQLERNTPISDIIWALGSANFFPVCFLSWTPACLHHLWAAAFWRTREASTSQSNQWLWFWFVVFLKNP